MSPEVEDERVEELEKRLSEMEATVRGLTEELVDANTRIRELEELEGLHEPIERVPRERVRSGEDATADASAEGAEASKDAEANEDTEDEETGLGDDIIVA